MFLETIMQQKSANKLVFRFVALAAAVVAGAAFGRPATVARAAAPPPFSRASLANTAAFTVTNTVAPKGGSKSQTVLRVEVKGSRARLDYNNPVTGPVTYLANEKGVFLYVPANKVAQQQNFQGGVERALQIAFEQANRQLRTAKKTGTATVSGQPTDVYKDARSGATIYVGRAPGFKLPIKTVVTNEGGTRTLLVSNIKTNIALSDARFSLPAGVQIIRPNGAAAGGGGVPGFGGR